MITGIKNIERQTGYGRKALFELRDKYGLPLLKLAGKYHITEDAWNVWFQNLDPSSFEGPGPPERKKGK